LLQNASITAIALVVNRWVAMAASDDNTVRYCRELRVAATHDRYAAERLSSCDSLAFGAAEA
jgi:hypothetical protein